jgi:hypothetical protein
MSYNTILPCAMRKGYSLPLKACMIKNNAARALGQYPVVNSIILPLELLHARRKNFCAVIFILFERCWSRICSFVYPYNFHESVNIASQNTYVFILSKNIIIGAYCLVKCHRNFGIRIQ